MQISYTTKEESNKQREKAFLALSPDQRFWRFVALSKQLKMFTSTAKPENEGNFVIKFYKDED